MYFEIDESDAHVQYRI